MKQSSDIPYGPDPLQTYDIYHPDVLADGFPVIIHFHGGGLNGGNKSFHSYVEQLVSLGYTFFDCNYRLVPAVTPDEILVDCANATRQIIDSLPAIGKAGKIFIAGDSAGGWITMMMCFRPDVLGRVSLDPDTLGGFVFDDAMPLKSCDDLGKYAYVTDYLKDPTCPLYYLSQKRNYPPMYFSTYGRSIQKFPEYTHMAVATLFRMGFGDRVTFAFYPNLVHCGNFEAPAGASGLIPYVEHTSDFYKKAMQE